MSKLLIISHKHRLFPLAHRLQAEGHECEVITWRPRYAKAWGGKVGKGLRGDKEFTGEVRNLLESYINRVKAGEFTVVSDSRGSVSEMFNNLGGYLALEAESPPESELRVGGWFDGEHLTGLHLLVYDLGVWPGGLGPRQPGGLTLVNPTLLAAQQASEVLAEALQPVESQLKAANFKGLVNLGVEQSLETGELGLRGLEAGWPWLHTEAWLSSTNKVGEMLSGRSGNTQTGPSVKFTVVVPVSIPPWPSPNGTAAQQPIENLTPQQQARWFWYDMVPNPTNGTLTTAGLDGLVGVARGEAENFEGARIKAIQLAHRVGLREKQFRPDVGTTVGFQLALLEERFGLVL